ncbi:murein DD-endopeptidase MepM [Oxobacter pfennigii]|uniref:Murein DD-endopeptidase MepM n=1 Tax=Oxobacter pfennigii TaxID=36849 RepID=A0A0P8W4V5_9CLOT|nr:M23 family metallopeptidase [Oxobacter pfennigii]KPU42855.1 murein DD-endopeptidase MepM [Oxobacter pfennigii]
MIDNSTEHKEKILDVKRAVACTLGVVLITSCVYLYSHNNVDKPVTYLSSNDVIVNLNTLQEIEEIATFYAVTINGEEVGYVDSEESYNAVVEGIKAYNKEQEESTGVEVLNISIKDEIGLKQVEGDKSKVMDTQAMIDFLIAGKGLTIKYEVKSGDSMWRISRNNNISMDEIAALNPGIDLEKLQIGQTINLAVSEPYIDIETTVKAQYDEKIPYTTKYIDDSTLYRGQTEVKEAGKNGIKQVVKEITKLNGKEVVSNVLSTAVIKEPAIRVMSRGTKALVGSGQFLWPLNGTLTSGFGSRSGGYHKGIDIAAPIGSGIYASDGGTVTLAQRYYDYGLLVTIDHGNGYTTYYGHCSKLYVSKGDTVTKGQKIAAVGMTGFTTGPHVHFEIRQNGTAKNPMNYLD